MHVLQLLAVSPVLKRVECSYETRNRDRSALNGTLRICHAFYYNYDCPRVCETRQNIKKV